MSKHLDIKFPVKCPVCGNEFKEKPLDYQLEDWCYLSCDQCGWVFNYEQLLDLNFIDPKNEKSIEQLKIEYEQEKLKNPKYKWINRKISKEPHKCPVCDKYTFEDVQSYDICPQCGWEDSGMHEFPDEICGCNKKSFKEFKKAYKEKINDNPKYKWSKDK